MKGMLPDQMEGMTAINPDYPSTTATDTDTTTYTAYNPEDGTVQMELSGDDKDMFMLDDGPANCPADPEIPQGITAEPARSSASSPCRTSRCRETRNQDNVYNVTVVASDGGMNDDRMVTVKVTDNADEMGMVELSSLQDAVIGVPITATLTKDSDGGVPDPATLTGVMWTWERGNDTNPDNTNTADQDDIEDEESDTYTPTTADKDMYLRATAMYTDRTRDATNLFMNDGGVGSDDGGPEQPGRTRRRSLRMRDLPSRGGEHDGADRRGRRRLPRTTNLLTTWASRSKPRMTTVTC